MARTIKQTRSTAQERAGIIFPVRRIHRYLKVGTCTGRVTRVGDGAAVYTAAVLEYLLAEVLELAGTAVKDNKPKGKGKPTKSSVKPRHLQLAIRNDPELSLLVKDSIIPDGGVIPYIHATLLPNKATAGSGASRRSRPQQRNAYYTPADDDAEGNNVKVEGASKNFKKSKKK